MVEQLMTVQSAASRPKQLFARNGEYATMPILVDDAINATLLRGALLFAPTPAGPFVQVKDTALPNLTTDVIVVLGHDLTLVAAGGDLKAVGYMGPGEFIKETVQQASAPLSDANLVTVMEALILRSINLVHSAYADVPGETP